MGCSSRLRKFFTILKNIRYLLDGKSNVSYTESELKPVDQNAKYNVKKIIGRKVIKGSVNYLVWWNKYKKSEATYEPRTELIKDGLSDMIKDYEKNK